MAQERGWLLLTNDDGIEAVGLETLVKALHDEGYPVAVLAPSGNHSATGMRINLMKPMAYRPRDDLVERWGLNPHTTPVHLFELDGTPCDTMIVALDGGLNHLVPGVHPQMVVSGVNLGPNLSQDSYHSGTMGAAREAGLYGVPAIAASFTPSTSRGGDGGGGQESQGRVRCGLSQQRQGLPGEVHSGNRAAEGGYEGEGRD